MGLLENIRLAISGLLSNKMRSVLTMLGIIIGISSVITITTIGNSVKKSVSITVSQWGVNNIYVYLQQKVDWEAVDSGEMLYEYKEPTQDDFITDEMMDEIMEEYPGQIKSFSVQQDVGSGKSENGEDYANVNISGVNEGYLSANKLELIKGRFLTRRDSLEKRKVAVVSDKFAEAMFGDNSPVGKSINVLISETTTEEFYIVGVYQYDMEQMGYNPNASDKDITTSMYIPIKTSKTLDTGNSMYSDAANLDGYDNVTIIASEDSDANIVQQNVSQFFEEKYADNENYETYSYGMQSDLDEINKMLNAITIAVSAIAAISLLVGGIGVMNIMLVSITERTKEIGVRKALGAKNGAIRTQFIVEAIIICLTGGIIGITIGVLSGCGASSIVMQYMMDGSMEYSISPSMNIILIAMGFSMLIGVFFGYYPANKAAKMNPIDALRYE